MSVFEQFVKAHAPSPWHLVLDVDATDTPLRYEQEERFLHAYYDGYCYLPLVVCVLRSAPASELLAPGPSGIGPARHAWAILSVLVKVLRAHWPRVEIVVRGDSGFFAGGGCCGGAKRMECVISWGSRRTPVCIGKRRRCSNVRRRVTKPRASNSSC